MIYLEDDGTGAAPTPAELEQLQAILLKLQDGLSQLLTASRSNQKEAKAWLFNAVAGLGLRDPGLRRRKFGQYLPGGSAYERKQHGEFARQLLQALLADKPQQVARLVSREPSALKHFFRADISHVRLWFGHFSMGGMAEFRHGALALARYALLHRDEVWRLLAWGGKHPQAPVAVAQKTHYFCELDVPATVENFLEQCPEFWESQELKEVLAGGQLLAMAPNFWAEELCGWLREYSSRSDSLYGLVCDYLESGADWRRLCGVLLPLLPPADLLGFASGLLDDVPLPPAAAAAGTAGAAAAAAAVAVGTPGMPPSPPPGAFLVLRGACWGSLEALLVAAAVGCSLRQLGRLVREEENGQELQEMSGLAEQLAGCETAALHWRLRCELLQQAAAQQRERQPEQGAGQQAEQQRQRRQQRAEHAEQSAPAAVRTEERQHSGAGGPASPSLGIQAFLLLHMWAAYLHLHQLAAAAAGGSEEAAEQFLGLARQAGLECRQAGAGAAEAVAAGAGAAAERVGRGGKRRRNKEKKRSKGSKKKQRRHKKRRRRSGDTSSSSSGSGSEGETGGWWGGGRAAAELAEPGGGGGSTALWAVSVAEGGEVSLTGSEVADLAIERLAASYAAWLCSHV